MIPKTIIILLAVIAITIPITVNAMVESWIEYDCDKLKAGMIPICNDINKLDDRLNNVEKLLVDIRDTENSNRYATVDIPFVVDGFVAQLNDVEWSDRITLVITNPGREIIYNGTQPTTFTPDRNGNWFVTATVNGWYYEAYRFIEATGGEIPIIDVTLTILYGETEDYLQVNATGFYPNDSTLSQSENIKEGIYELADNEGNLSIQFERELKSYLSPGVTIDVEVTDRTTPATGFASIIYNPNNGVNRA